MQHKCLCFVFLICLCDSGSAQGDPFVSIVDNNMQQTTFDPSLIEEMSVLESTLIQIHYAKAADLATLLKNDQNTLLSQRGNASFDLRTNTLLVQDTAEKVTQIREIVAKLDIPVRQVVIQSRIVSSSKRFEKELGILWGVSSNARASGSARSAAANATDKLNVNLGTQTPAFGTIGLSVATLGGDTLLDLELQAAQSESIADIIASPRLMTANQKEARIKQGKQIPYQESSASGATTTAFKEAVLELRVTPQITPDDKVILDLVVKQDVLSGLTVQDNIPIIDTKEVETQVLVNDGETVVLGGIFERTKNQALRRIPFFSDLPVLGALFRATLDQDDRSELLIFVTPKITAHE